MTQKVQLLLSAALDLDDDERTDLAGALLATLEPPSETELERHWKREVSMRVEALDAGDVQTVPWNEVLDELYSRLSAQRPG